MPPLRRLLLPILLLLGVLATAPACSTLSSPPQTTIYRGESIERPAGSLDDGDGALDKVGKALVAGFVVCVAIAAIALPILLLA